MTDNQHYTAPTRETVTAGVSISDIILLSARLAQVLAEEVDLLTQMKVKDIDRLQKEKVWLTSALELQKHLLDRDPKALAGITDYDREELEKIWGVFETVRAENHRKLKLAHAVNQKVVQVIRDTVQEASRVPAYAKGGGQQTPDSLSITLNQCI